MAKRVLLDENLGYRFGKQLGAGFAVESMRYRGWAGTSNGELLALAEADFDVLLTRDGNLGYQNRIHDKDIASTAVSTGRSYVTHTRPRT